MICGKQGRKWLSQNPMDKKEKKKLSESDICDLFISPAIRQAGWDPLQQVRREENITLRPCACLHNCEANDVINHSFYQEHTEKAPAFLKNDVRRLQDFIKQHVKYGDSDNIMYRIDHGKIKPSASLLHCPIR